MCLPERLLRCRRPSPKVTSRAHRKIRSSCLEAITAAMRSDSMPWWCSCLRIHCPLHQTIAGCAHAFARAKQASSVQPSCRGFFFAVSIGVRVLPQMRLQTARIAAVGGHALLPQVRLQIPLGLNSRYRYLAGIGLLHGFEFNCALRMSFDGST